jgi:hypothetical protein
VAVKLWARPLRVPVLIEKTLALEASSATLHIDERLTSEAHTPLDIMWGHHIAFGLPFLRDGAVIETNARQFVADASMPSPRRFKPDVETDWPAAPGMDGGTDDASFVPPEDAPPYSDLAYLSGFDQQAWYAIKSVPHGVGFRVTWDGHLFKHVWYWQERYASPDAPWWGRAYAVALEPWTTRYSPDADASIRRGEWLHLDAGQVITTKLTAAGVEA